MTWRLDTSRNVEKFLEKNDLSLEEVREIILNAILFFQGEPVSIDIRKLKGAWRRFFRIRAGRIRIIAAFDFDKQTVFVDTVDWRGNVYKK